MATTATSTMTDTKMAAEAATAPEERLDIESQNSQTEPITEVAIPKETWKYPVINRLRVAACLWSFTVLGANDAAVGALIPYVRHH
jgi:hypothetical protein